MATDRQVPFITVEAGLEWIDAHAQYLYEVLAEPMAGDRFLLHHHFFLPEEGMECIVGETTKPEQTAEWLARVKPEAPFRVVEPGQDW